MARCAVMLQRCYRGVTVVLCSPQVCSGVTEVLQRCYSGALQWPSVQKASFFQTEERARPGIGSANMGGRSFFMCSIKRRSEGTGVVGEPEEPGASSAGVNTKSMTWGGCREWQDPFYSIFSLVTHRAQLDWCVPVARAPAAPPCKEWRPWAGQGGWRSSVVVWFLPPSEMSARAAECNRVW